MTTTAKRRYQRETHREKMSAYVGYDSANERSVYLGGIQAIRSVYWSGNDGECTFTRVIVPAGLVDPDDNPGDVCERLGLEYPGGRGPGAFYASQPSIRYRGSFAIVQQRTGYDI